MDSSTTAPPLEVGAGALSCCEREEADGRECRGLMGHGQCRHALRRRGLPSKPQTERPVACPDGALFPSASTGRVGSEHEGKGSLDHRAATRARCVWRVPFVSSSRSGYLQRAQFDAQHDCQVVELVIDNDRALTADGHGYDHEAGHHHCDHEANPRPIGLARVVIAISCALRKLRRSERRISAWGGAAQRGGSHVRDAGNHLHARQGPL